MYTICLQISGLVAGGYSLLNPSSAEVQFYHKRGRVTVSSGHQIYQHAAKQAILPACNLRLVTPVFRGR